MITLTRRTQLYWTPIKLDLLHILANNSTQFSKGINEIKIPKCMSLFISDYTVLYINGYESLYLQSLIQRVVLPL